MSLFFFELSIFFEEIRKLFEKIADSYALSKRIQGVKCTKVKSLGVCVDELNKAR